MLKARREGAQVVVYNEGTSVARDIQTVPGSITHASLGPGESVSIDVPSGATIVKYLDSLNQVIDVPIE